MKKGSLGFELTIMVKISSRCREYGHECDSMISLSCLVYLALFSLPYPMLPYFLIIVPCSAYSSHGSLISLRAE